MSSPTTHCFVCREVLTDIAPLLTCSVCNRRCHRRCARSSLGGSDNIPLSLSTWICPDCESHRPPSFTPLLSDDHFQAIMSQLTNLTQVVSSCDKKIEDLNNTVLAQSLAITNCLNDIAALRDENNLLRNKIAIVENKMNDFPTLSPEEIFAESAERLKRKKNIILMGIPETSPDEEITFIKGIISALVPDSVDFISSGARLGKNNNNRPRPYRVTFQNSEVALAVLKRKSNLQRDLYPTVKIVTDMTPNQTQHINNLRQELQTRLKTEKNLTIKYINGIPKIIHVAADKDTSKRGREEKISPKRDSGLKVSKPSTSEKK